MRLTACMVLVSVMSECRPSRPAATIALRRGGLTLHRHGQQVFIEQEGLLINAQSTNAFLGHQNFGAGPLSFFIPFGNPGFVADVALGDQWCNSDVDEPPCGELTFTSPGLPPLPPERAEPFIATTPFAASGYIRVGGVKHELRGRGTLSAIICFSDDCPIPEDQGPQFNFGFSGGG